MKKEIYQRYWKTEIVKTKANKLLEVCNPKGVFVARLTNKGKLVISLSLLHKNDRFNIKEGLNKARQNASKLNQTVYLSKDHQAAYERFEQRAKRYFRIDAPKVTKWTGKLVRLNNSSTWYFVHNDNGAYIDCSHVGEGTYDAVKNIPAKSVIYYNQSKQLFISPNENNG